MKSSIRFRQIFLAILLGCFGNAYASGAGQIAFQNFPSGTGAYYVYGDIGCDTNFAGNIGLAQEFTAGVSGVVESVSAFLGRGRVDAYPLTVEIRGVTNDNLPGQMLGSATDALINGANPASLTTIHFNDSIAQLTTGENYYAVFKVPTRPFNQRKSSTDYTMWTVADNPRSSGMRWLLSEDGFFINYNYGPPEAGLVVTVVPEPAATSQLLVAILLLAGCYWRK